MLFLRDRTALVLAAAALCCCSGCLALSFGGKEIHEFSDDLRPRIEALEARVQILEQDQSGISMVVPHLPPVGE